jgi:hypothetical protein
MRKVVNLAMVLVGNMLRQKERDSFSPLKTKIQ